jgi:anaerobic magnesium-protoporphyrin IX monomethyl ester cyclase
MVDPIDILFVTHVRVPRDSGSEEVYRPLRLQIGEQVATIPLLRALAHGDDPAASKRPAAKPTPLGFPPVLTPFYLEDYMERRGITLREIPCIETHTDLALSALKQGVRLIALCTTWLPGSGGATYVRKAAGQLRALAPNVPIVAGGVGVRKGLRARDLLHKGELVGMSPEDLARDYLLIDPNLDQDLDAIILSEGSEATLAEVALQLKSGSDFRKLPNLAFSRNGEFVFTPHRPEISDVDGETVDWSRHRDRLGPYEAPVRTAVGCPFRCEFCDFAGLYQPRVRTTDSLVTELRTLTAAQPPPRRVFFTDDNVAITRQRLTEFTRALIRENLGLSWRGFVRADAVDADVADLMLESGCRECLLGIESGDPAILRNMDKRLDPTRAMRAVELLDARGINTQCSFVVGFPGECAASIDRTAAFISSLPSGDSAKALHRYYLFRFELVPLCPAARREGRDRFGLTGMGDRWAHKTMNSAEAKEAVREIFLKVDGPTHMYLEHAPQDWPLSATRRVMEVRDSIQKARIRGANPAERLGHLYAAVQAAEGAARAR